MKGGISHREDPVDMVIVYHKIGGHTPPDVSNDPTYHIPYQCRLKQDFDQVWWKLQSVRRPYQGMVRKFAFRLLAGQNEPALQRHSGQQTASTALCQTICSKSIN